MPKRLDRANRPDPTFGLGTTPVSWSLWTTRPRCPPGRRTHRRMQLWLTVVDAAPARRLSRPRSVQRSGRHDRSATLRASGSRRSLGASPAAAISRSPSGRQPSADTDLLGHPPLLDGAVCPPAALPRQPSDRGARRPRRWQVTGGPGRRAARSPRRLGRTRSAGAADADVRIDDPDLSRRHLVEISRPAGARVLDLRYDQRHAAGRRAARLQQSHDPGRSGPAACVPAARRSSCAPTGSPSAATAFDGAGHRGQPSTADAPAAEPAPRSRFPAPPEHRDARPASAARDARPAAARPCRWPGCSTPPTYLLFGLMSPAMMLGSFLSERRGGRRDDRRRRADWQPRADRARARARRRAGGGGAAATTVPPDLAQLLQTVADPAGPPLGAPTRRPRLPAAAARPRPAPPAARSGCRSVRPRRPSRHRSLDDVPVTVALTDSRRPRAGRTRGGVCSAWPAHLVAQIAGWHSPRDVELVVLAADDDGLDDWRVGRAAPPHATRTDGVVRAPAGRAGPAGPGARQRLAELAPSWTSAAPLRTRRAARRAQRPGPTGRGRRCWTAPDGSAASARARPAAGRGLREVGILADLPRRRPHPPAGRMRCSG